MDGVDATTCDRRDSLVSCAPGPSVKLAGLGEAVRYSACATNRVEVRVYDGQETDRTQAPIDFGGQVIVARNLSKLEASFGRFWCKLGRSAALA